MSSMMQFRGSTDSKGRVGLQFVLRADDAAWNAPPLEPVACPVCGKEHERIHIAFRRPAGMFGPWVVFRYNGEKHVPDLSIPISVSRLPKDAVALDDDENARAWHS
jgi:hypothetical protein